MNYYQSGGQSGSLYGNVTIYPQTMFGPPREGSPEAGRLLREKITYRLGVSGNKIRFLPFVDNVVEETAEMRLAYRAMLRVPEVKAAFMTKVFGVASLDLTIHPSNEKKARDRQVARFVEESIEQAEGGIRHIVQSILYGALMDGFSVSEKVWELTPRGRWEGKYRLRVLKGKDTERLMLLGDQYRNVTGIYDYFTGITHHPGNFVLFSYQSIFENPLGLSDFRAAYAAYWKLDTVWKLRMLGLDRFTLPALVGSYTERSDKQELEDALGDLRSLSWASIPEGVKIEVLDMAARAEGEFKSAVDDLREEIFLAISGAFLQSLTGGQGDIRGDSKVHQNTTQLWQWMLAADVTDVVNGQVIPDYVDLNYRDADYPTASLSAVNLQEMQQELMIDQGLSQLGLPLSKEACYERYNREPPRNAEDALTKTADGQGVGMALGGMMPGMGGMDMGGQQQAMPGMPGGQPGMEAGMFGEGAGRRPWLDPLASRGGVWRRRGERNKGRGLTLAVR